MLDKPEIRLEIEASLKTKDPKFLQKIEAELDVMDTTDGLGGKTNLQSFYEMWQDHKEVTGNKNDINSWTAVALGLTSEKPSGEFLPMRRAFARAGFPDIDGDFDDERRQEVYQYLIDKYGRDRVGNIGTYIRQKMKGAIRSVTRAIDAASAYHHGPKECKTANFELANEITRTLPVLPNGTIRWTDSNGEEISIKNAQMAYKHIPEFKDYMDKYPDILRHTANIEGLGGAFGMHAAGVVISDVPLYTLCPLRSSKKGFATQYAMEDLEVIGLIKFDILSIAALTVIRDVCELVEENYGIKLDMENLPLDDDKTLSFYRSGKLDGVFQCENSGMQRTMREIGVDSFADVMAAVALYRPGPMDSIPEYVARKNGNSRIDYFHPTIEPFVKKYLSHTYGVLVYQEQLMQICNSLAGFTITDGYIMIKAVGKKKQYLMDKFAKQFVQGGVKNGVPEDIMKQYWTRFITPFANYGFNASHCLNGNMRVKDVKDEKFYTIEDLYNIFMDSDNIPDIVLNSYVDGNLVEDNIIDVFSTGEQDVYEVNLSNGMKLECTLKHKFLCSDQQIRTLDNIIEGDYEILYEVDIVN
jgi:DNA polymerase III subunit alpha